MSTRENLLQERDTHRENLFLSCAGLILPWLTPQELASISLTCKSLKHIAKSITVARSSDAARSFESLPIPFVNTVDSLPYADFIYTPTQLLPYYRQCSRQFWGPVNPSFNHISRLHFISSSSNSLGGAFGCNCGSKCDGESNEEECPCLALRSSDVITECGPTCRCESECVNRLTQKGVSVKIKIVRDMNKGWGLHADQQIPNGQFVCEYAGGNGRNTCKLQLERRQVFMSSVELMVGLALLNSAPAAAASRSEFADMPAIRGKDYGKTKMRYADYTETESGLQYKDLRVGSGPTPKLGETVVVDWDGFTIGYYGRIFEARNKTKGGSFEGDDKDYYKFKIGSQEVIPAFEEAVSSMAQGGIRRIIVPPELGYPGNDFNKKGPRPTTFSGQRALDFVLRNQGLIDKTLLFDIELLKIISN